MYEHGACLHARAKGTLGTAPPPSMMSGREQRQGRAPGASFSHAV